ncbi:hypothetical protein E2C01_073833 [Portunus trituberculatus]|uniref:Uncharacterized protein n=1 Tax=Portunus trituberculatus TaxID=210409 RepID=A0A5B7I6E2_PORTR|nr:hypothetical protein [Portunus trituberculatus]
MRRIECSSVCGPCLATSSGGGTQQQQKEQQQEDESREGVADHVHGSPRLSDLLTHSRPRRPSPRGLFASRPTTPL